MGLQSIYAIHVNFSIKVLLAVGEFFSASNHTQLTGRSSSNHDVLHQMVEGGNEPGTYEYGIELIHHTCPNQCVIRKFSSDFEASVRILLVFLHFCGILIDAYIDDDQSC